MAENANGRRHSVAPPNRVPSAVALTVVTVLHSCRRGCSPQNVGIADTSSARHIAATTAPSSSVDAIADSVVDTAGSTNDTALDGVTTATGAAFDRTRTLVL